MTFIRLRAYLYLLIVALIWGVASVVIKVTLEGVDPFPFLTYRFAVAALIGIIHLVVFKRRLPSLPILLGAIVYGLLSSTLALTFLFLGLEKTNVLSLSLISLTGPLLLASAGVVFLHEHITHREKIGTIVAVVGTLFTIIEPILNSGATNGEIVGNIFLILYIVADVASLIVLKKVLRKKVDTITLTNIAFIVAFTTLLPITLIQYPLDSLVLSIKNLELGYHLGVWYMALISGTLAYALRAKAQKSIEVGEGALFGYMTAVFSAPLAVIFLHEIVSPLFIIGAVVIVIGIFIAEKK